MCSKMNFCRYHIWRIFTITGRIAAVLGRDSADEAAFHPFDLDRSGVGINCDHGADRVFVNYLIADAFVLFIPFVREKMMRLRNPVERGGIDIQESNAVDDVQSAAVIMSVQTEDHPAGSVL